MEKLKFLLKAITKPSPIKKLSFEVQKAGGQTNRNFIATLGKEKFFVRLPWQKGNIMNRTAEGKNILELSRSKKLGPILPRYLAYIMKERNILSPKGKGVFKFPNGTMVTDFVEGREFTMKDFQHPFFRRKLAQMFYAFHASPVRFCNTYNVFEDEVKKYRLSAKKYDISKFIDAKTITLLERIEKQGQQELPSLKKGISTHNDFLFQNVLVGKNRKLYLLDFEYAGLNMKGGIAYDYGFLLADSLFRKPKMTQELFEKFLNVADKVYKKPLNRKHIYWSSFAAMLVQFWWGLLRYFSVKTPKEKKYFKEYAQKRAKGVLKLHRSLKEKS